MVHCVYFAVNTENEAALINCMVLNVFLFYEWSEHQAKFSLLFSLKIVH